MITVSIEAFKLMALLNGGAAAGIIAAYDKVSAAVDPGSLKLSICLFVLGLVCVGGAFVCSYLTQNVLFNELMGFKEPDSHMPILKFGMGCVVFSLAFFSAGALVAGFNIHEVQPCARMPR
ncbi:hypothetical protein Bphy_1923 [Paraburkholderia phymatum STM815]|uniref:Uncharacterized protein n=2 Tax=Paraburkholderia phymatum TaxID=148447 RepID=B2JD46_PARP8|nr:hypothetical protein Bphy_1923 [Paraburkholderia phymatum STM815]